MFICIFKNKHIVKGGKYSALLSKYSILYEKCSQMFSF